VWWPSINRDGRYLVFSTQAALVFRDTNTLKDAYLYDTSLGTYTLISADAAGNATGGETPQISPNGDAVSYVIPSGSREPRIFYRASRTFRTPSPRSPDANPLRRCSVTSLSLSGRYAAVQCDHIYPGSGDDWISQGFCVDTFLNTSGMEMTEDGRGVVMTSSANNLVPDDTNGKSDAFFAYCQ
jgi:TolB protein